MARVGKAIWMERCAELAGNSFLFAGIEKEAVQQALMQPGVSLEQFASGAEIFSPEADRQQLGILIEGQAWVYKQSGEDRLLLSVLEAGDITGAASLFSPQQTFTTAVVARGSVRMLLFSREAVEAMLRQDFRLTRNFLGYLTGRIHFLTHRLQDVSRTTAQQKLLGYLQQLAEGGRVQLTMGMTGLSQALSIGRASLYRAMEQLQEQGALRREGKTIYLLEHGEH